MIESYTLLHEVSTLIYIYIYTHSFSDESKSLFCPNMQANEMTFCETLFYIYIYIYIYFDGYNNGKDEFEF